MQRIIALALVMISVGCAGSRPRDAIVLFDGKDLSKWQGKDGGEAKWKLVDDAMEVNGTGDIATRETFGDCELHVEFRTPEPKEGQTGQNRGNSGVFLLNLYEIQVLDSYGLTPAKGDCASVYNQKPPDVNAALPPLVWQTYDIDFRAPRFDSAGKKTESARVTVILNGKKVHDNVEILKGTSGKSPPEQPGDAPIRLQDHHHPVQFRNIWVVPKSEK